MRFRDRSAFVDTGDSLKNRFHYLGTSLDIARWNDFKKHRLDTFNILILDAVHPEQFVNKEKCGRKDKKPHLTHYAPDT